MATVTGLTSEQMAELAAGWNAVAERQAENDAEISALRDQLALALQQLAEFNGTTVPNLQNQVGGSASTISNINDGLIPGINQQLDDHDLTLAEINGVDLPSLQAQIDSAAAVINDIPKEFNQPDMPLDSDDPDRSLVVGDKWFDTDDNNKEYRWTGTEWVESGITIPDLSLTVQKFKTGTHMIY